MTSKSADQALPEFYLGFQPASILGRLSRESPLKGKTSLRLLVENKPLGSNDVGYFSQAQDKRKLAKALGEKVSKWYEVCDSLPMDALMEEKMLPSEPDDIFVGDFITTLNGSEIAALLNEQGALPHGLGSKYVVAETVLQLYY